MTFPGSKGCFEDRWNSLGLTVLCNRPLTGRATETFFSRNTNLWASSELKWRKASINILTLVIESSVGAIMGSWRTQHANTLYRNKEEVPDMTNTHQPRFYTPSAPSSPSAPSTSLSELRFLLSSRSFSSCSEQALPLDHQGSADGQWQISRDSRD